MKRLWIGLLLLGTVLLSGLLTPALLEHCHRPVAQALAQASDRASAGDWTQVRALTDTALENWQKKRPVTAALADHEPMDDIDGMLRQLQVYAALEDTLGYRVTCVYLGNRLDALGDYHRLTWWNLL